MCLPSALAATALGSESSDSVSHTTVVVVVPPSVPSLLTHPSRPPFPASWVMSPVPAVSPGEAKARVRANPNRALPARAEGLPPCAIVVRDEASQVILHVLLVELGPT